MSSDMLWGIAIGVAGTYAFHRWVRPMKSSKSRG